MTPRSEENFEMTPDTPKGGAAHWLAMRRSGAMTGAEERELQAWLDQSEANRTTFEEMERAWRVMGAVRDDPEVMALRETNARMFNRPSRDRAIAAIAACAVVAAGAAWVSYDAGVLDHIIAPPQPAKQEFRTSIGQRATVTLADGSIVTLDTDTVLHTWNEGRKRRVELDRGQAFFRVAKDRHRPFSVTAAGTTVTATGTAFEVSVEPGETQVVLTEGRVKVDEPPTDSKRARSTDLRVGWRLVVRDDDRGGISPVDIEKEMSWLTGRLTFVNDPLGDAVEVMNRYSERKIVIRDQQVADAPIVGVFRAGDVEGFVKAVRLHKLARVSVEDDDVVALSSP